MGGCVQVPIWVRGMGGGKQRLRLLLRYEREGASSSAKSLPLHRFVEIGQVRAWQRLVTSWRG